VSFVIKKLYFLSFFIGFAFSLSSKIIVTSAESKIAFLTPSSGILIHQPLSVLGGSVDATIPGTNALRGGVLTLKDGKIEIGGLSGTFSGSFDPSLQGELFMQNGDSLSGDAGCLLKKISILGGGVVLSGWIDAREGIFLRDSGSSLSLYLENRLFSSISLNGGRLTLLSSLRMDNGKTIQGPGTVILNGASLFLSLGGSVGQGSVVFVQSGGLVLEDTLSLSGKITFSAENGARESFFIAGQGCDLDLSLGGTVYIASGCSLTMENVNIKKLGKGAIILQDSTASLTFIGCTLELATDYYFSRGNLSFIGRNSTVIVGERVCYFNEECKLLVDAISLFFDPLSSTNNNGIQLIEPAEIIVKNGGKVVSISKVYADLSLTIDNSYSVRSGRFDLTKERKLFYRGLKSNSLILDGTNLILNFVDVGVDSGLIHVPTGKSAVLRNVEINNFSPASIKLDPNSNFALGDNALLNISRTVDLNYTLTIDGNVTISGFGEALNLVGYGKIFVRSGATVTFHNMTIAGLGNNYGRFVFESDTSTAIFKNVTLLLSDNYDHEKGVLKFVGSDSFVVTGKNTFSCIKKGVCIVDGVNLFYDPLAFPDTANIQPRSHDGLNIQCLQEGAVRVVGDVQEQGSLEITTSEYVLQHDEAISSQRHLSILGSGDECTVTGNGYSLILPYLPEPSIFVSANKNVHFCNIEFRDFSCEIFNLEKNSSISLGDGVVIKLNRDIVLSLPMNITGNVIFDLQGHDLRFEPGVSCSVASGATVTFKNGKFGGLSNELTPVDLSFGAKCVLQDMECFLDKDYSILNGDLIFQGSNFITTYKNTFAFLSSGLCTIKRQSSVSFYQGSTFLFAPEDRGRIVFEDKSSVLILYDATLVVRKNIMRLHSGLMKLFGHCVLDGGSAVESSGILINDKTFDIQVDYKATLEVVGEVVNY